MCLIGEQYETDLVFPMIQGHHHRDEVYQQPAKNVNIE